jgi:EpsI family protein
MRSPVVAPAFIPLLTVLAVAVVGLWPTWPPLLATWRDVYDYSHAPWVVLAAVCWVVARSTTLPPPVPRASAPGTALLLLEIAAWLVAWRAASNIGQQITMPLILWSAVWLACGWPVARRVTVPLACLYFAIPVWDLLLPALQSMTVAVSETLLGWLSVPVAIEGNRVTIPEGTFQIIEGCSGKRYLMMALGVAVPLGSMLRLTPRRAVALVAVTGLLALIMNWLRVMVVIYAGHVTDMTSYLIVREHLSLGWALFALLVGIVCLLARWLAEPAAVSPASTPTHARPAAQPHPLSVTRALPHWITHPAVLGTLFLLCLPALGVAYARAALRSPPEVAPAQLPRAVTAEWRGPESPDTLWSPRFQGAAAELRGAYGGSDHTVEVYVATYHQGGQLGAKLVSSSNLLLPPDWSVILERTLDDPRIPAQLRGAHTIEAVSPQATRWVVSYLYQIDEAVTASPLLAQLEYGVRSWHASMTARVIAVAARCHDDCEPARRDLADFWSQVGTRLIEP